MPFEQTVTIINNSGKIISTGKHLVGIFKEAKLAYREKKEAIKQEQNGNIRRARTFDAQRDTDHTYNGPIVEEFDDGRSFNGFEDSYYRHRRAIGHTPSPRLIESSRRSSQDDGNHRSRALSQSHHSHRSYRSSSTGSSHRHKKMGHSRVGHAHDGSRSSRPPLTESNLRTHSEVSATAPSAVPRSYRNSPGTMAPYTSHDMIVSRATLDEAATTTGRDSSHHAISTPHLPMASNRSMSTPSLPYRGSGHGSSRPKSIDLNLAYGSIPPDLASRADLDTPVSHGDAENGRDEDQEEAEARTLIGRIELILDEARCIHHTAASIIAHLQDNPEAAAAVALTLAELSTMLTKLSPAFLGIVQGGSPAVFALLASPQFLIGSGIAVGMTVVIFGGWKIVKRITEIQAGSDANKQPFDVSNTSGGEQQQKYQDRSTALPHSHQHKQLLVDGNSPATLISGGFDEALVLEEELSTIETWRRGIVPPFSYEHEDGRNPDNGGDVVDAELISPEAMRSRIGDDERTLRSIKSSRSHKNTAIFQSTRGRHHNEQRQGDSSNAKGKERKTEKLREMPEKRSNRGSVVEARDGNQDQTSNRNRDRLRDRPQDRSKDRRDRRGDGDASEASSATSNHGNDKKNRSSGNMLKQLFKKKEKADKDHSGTAIPAVVR